MYQRVKLNVSSKHSIDTNGVVWNDETGRPMRGGSLSKHTRYVKVVIGKRGYAVHRLVLLHFVGMPPEGFTANHIDGNRYNNRLSNLEWVEHRANVQHTYSNRLNTGHVLNAAKLSWDTVNLMRSMPQLSARQLKSRLRLPIGLTAIRNIMAFRTWNDNPSELKIKPTPELRPHTLAGTSNHNAKLDEETVLTIKRNAYLLGSAASGKRNGSRLSMSQFISKLNLDIPGDSTKARAQLVRRAITGWKHLDDKLNSECND